MSQHVTVRRSLAASAVLALMTAGATSIPAFAEPGNSNSNGHGNGGSSATAPGHVKDKDNKGKNHQAHGHQGGNGNAHGGNSHANEHASGHQGGNGTSHAGGNGHAAGAGSSHAGGAGDPAGNNGTVKIETLGDLDGIPNNTPHPGCTFQIEWYGFDEGADIVSTVGFAMQAPTSDVGLTVDGPSTVFVGGDPATGAGTDTGLDGTQAYTLSFDGAPHPKQGYHLKLTVATPRSHGNDTKTKVFWVEPCESTPAEETPGEEVLPGEETPGDTGVSPSEEELAGEVTTTEQGVLGTQAETTQNNAEMEAAAAGADVPTKVDAGEEGTLGNLASSPIALTIAGLGILIAAGGLLARRRSGATPLS